MRFINKSVLLFCVLALAFTACRKPESSIVSDIDEPIVKKYLVKQLLNDDPERIMLAIDWNDDFTKILHVKYGLGYGSVLDYDFTYYGEDSIRVSMSLPPDSYPLWEFWYDILMIHLSENKIDSICCYANGELRDVEHYNYNEEGRLIEREYFGGVYDSFVWEGDDVVEYKYYGMNNTPDDDTRVMLAGCIVAGALEMSNPPMNDHWNIHRLFQKTKYSFKDNYCLIQLVSSFRTEKVYGDWC